MRQMRSIIRPYSLGIQKNRRDEKKTLETASFLWKAENGTRTHDPFITSEVLYQLSYFSVSYETIFYWIFHVLSRKTYRRIARALVYLSFKRWVSVSLWLKWSFISASLTHQTSG